ncbi:MAG: hypothetical protein GXO96_01020 [Nitrospirae bacterium]|nr:hypothetical protein [Candidatus Manganitrophaceae bacterium]
MKYKTLFTILVQHDYYTDGDCPDFAFEASTETAILLKNHRCVIKTQINGLSVSITVDDSGRAFIPLSSDAQFLFYLHLQNQFFSYFTDLTAFNQYEAPCFDNLEVPAETSALRLSTRQAEQPFSVRSPLVSRRIPDAFAEVLLLNNDSLPNEEAVLDEPALFQIVFTAKQARWIYYCVTDFNPALGDWAITDQASELSDRLSFSVENRLEFDADPESGDAVAHSLSVQYPEKRKIRFLSDEKVSCRQAARQEIALYMGENRLSEALPNPPVQNNSKLTIVAENSATEEETLFQVIKMLTA